MSHDNMFPLKTIYPGWAGQRAGYIREPLAHGLQILGEQLTSSQYALIEYQVEFDYDGPFDTISHVAPYGTQAEAIKATATLAEQSLATALAAHPTWHINEQPVYAANIMPFTASDTAQKFPPQIHAASAENSELCEKLYLRYYLISVANGPLIDQIACCDGLLHTLITYLVELDRTALREC